MRRDEILQAIDRLVTEQRDRCLWFLRSDYVPEDDASRHRTLMYIQRHATREAALKAAELSRWLSQSSSDVSAAS
jgi:hypothetical protein